MPCAVTTTSSSLFSLPEIAILRVEPEPTLAVVVAKSIEVIVNTSPVLALILK